MTSWPKVRAQVYARSGGKCEECGTRLRGRWDCAHKVPRYQGGDDSPENCAAKCPACHLSETKREAGHRAAGKKTSVATRHGQVVKTVRPKSKRAWPSRKIQAHSQGWKERRWNAGP